MVFMLIPESWVNVESETSIALVFLIWGILNAVCCFFIVRQDAKSIWYVPLIINAFMTFGGITDYSGQTVPPVPGQIVPPFLG